MPSPPPQPSRAGAPCKLSDELRSCRIWPVPPWLLRLADDILHANHVLALGQLHSGMPARQMAFRLNRFGLDCNALDDVTLMEGYQSVLKQGDVVVIFSISGQNSYRDLILPYRNNGARVVLVTMTAQAPISKLVDDVFLLPRTSHSSNGYLLDDAITFFTFVELLVEALHKLRFDAKTTPAQPDANVTSVCKRAGAGTSCARPPLCRDLGAAICPGGSAHHLEGFLQDFLALHHAVQAHINDSHRFVGNAAVTLLF